MKKKNKETGLFEVLCDHFLNTIMVFFILFQLYCTFCGFYMDSMRLWKDLTQIALATLAHKLVFNLWI